MYNNAYKRTLNDTDNRIDGEPIDYEGKDAF